MIKTLNLTANAEKSISNLGGDRCRIQNRTAGTLYVSSSPNITPCADGVMSIPAGRGDYFSYSMTSDTVYLLSAAGGNVELSGEHYYRPFDNAAGEKGGVAVGNPVVMDGLQGGVPFSEMVVSGDNIIGQDLTVNVSGKNLIPTDYMAYSGTRRGITVTVKDDGRVDLSGTATSEGYILDILSNFHLIGGKKYTFSCSKQYDVNTFNFGFVIKDKNGTWKHGLDSYPKTIIADDGDYISSWRLWTNSGVEYSAENVEIQMEIGDTATEYETPVGSKITITPDSNPYTVPDDIRQQDGLNVVTVSAGELTVSYSKTDPALSRIYKSIDSLATAIVAMGAEN